MGSTGSRSDWVSGIAATSTGIGILTFAIAPLAIPFMLLTIVAALPLAAPLIAFAAITLIFRGTRRGIRAAGRGFRRLQRTTAGPTAPRFTPPRPC